MPGDPEECRKYAAKCRKIQVTADAPKSTTEQVERGLGELRTAN